jgi:LmbE family N-acetylglucosaminyl deacetylase
VNHVEPIADNEIERVLVVTAHPDDLDFGAGGTLAKWAAAGIQISYCICTNGDQGGVDPSITREQMREIRQREQRAAGTVFGVTDIEFLNYRDGWLEPTITLRKDIVRAIRRVRPQRMLIQSAVRNLDRLGASHPDHLASGEAAIQAIYPDAGNQFAFEDLLHDEKLEPWTIQEAWIFMAEETNHNVDITDTFEKKLEAINSHVSQTAHNADLNDRIREWGAANAKEAGLPDGRLVERFRVIKVG